MLSRRQLMNDKIVVAQGENLSLVNVKGSKLNALSVYGKSTQDGTPSPENPVPIVSAGDDGEINVSVSDGGTQSQTLTISTPGGLPGIPVSSGGNYTDENGQQWVCNEKDFKRGKYVQRVWKGTFDGSEDEPWSTYYSTNLEGFYCADVLPEFMKKRASLCNQLIPYDSISSDNAIRLGANNKYIYCTRSSFYDPSLEDGGLANWKAHLAAHPLEVMTYLETPIETDLSDEEIAAYEALHTYSPTTTVSNDADAGVKIGYREWRR